MPSPPRPPRGKRVPEAVSPQQVAEILDVSLLTVRRWIYKGYIRAYRVGPKLVRIPRTEILRMRAVRIPFLIEGEHPRYPVV